MVGKAIEPATYAAVIPSASITCERSVALPCPDDGGGLWRGCRIPSSNTSAAFRSATRRGRPSRSVRRCSAARVPTAPKSADPQHSKAPDEVGRREPRRATPPSRDNRTCSHGARSAAAPWPAGRSARSRSSPSFCARIAVRAPRTPRVVRSLARAQHAPLRAARLRGRGVASRHSRRRGRRAPPSAQVQGSWSAVHPARAGRRARRRC